MPRQPAALAAAGLLTLAAGACASESSADDNAAVDLVAAFYPLEFVADRVGGEHAAVAGLTPPGAEAHDLELSPSQVADIDQADLAIYLVDFQPAVDDAIAQHAADSAFEVTEVVPLLEAAADDPHDHGGEEGEEGDDHADEEGEEDDHHEGEEGEEGDDHAEDEGEEADDHADEDGEDDHGSTDPHVWLDPDRLATIGEALAGRLGEADPDHADEYAANAAALGEELATLDTEFTDGLAQCERREIVVSHAAFGYLADRYDLAQIAITGLSPEDEPSPQRLEGVIEEAEEHGATTIFFEVLVSPDVAEVIADEVGAETAVLDPIEGLAPDSDDDYFSLMRNNLDALRAALGCT